MDDGDETSHLLARVALRDAQALESLYRRVAGRLMAVAWRVTQDRALAEDVLQEVFVGIWNRSAAAAPGEHRTLAWLCVVTRHRAIDLLRRRRPEEPLQWRTASGDESTHDIAAEGASPMEQLLGHEDDARLGRCMERLESEPRRALLLAFYEGLTHAEIALRMQRPLGTIKAWTRRSLMRLKGCMEALA
ncbi:RNA polymerase subunit sigma-24 [Hylemonella gracilis str. Niagara R]|uniref:RNA polymerase sigma factor n=1 Tax=Hylemonella gracilis str. Niagara R TaxID=1458275 RepID=A0A016XGU1_9BURK|nr:sigma-70 family RNA polymerase sigma factor [Hylemonella gracilis]EYC50428.1 RNA polymerase subunit sigma-24 [Hylemonella gracilis str. Niagara R]